MERVSKSEFYAFIGGKNVLSSQIGNYPYETTIRTRQSRKPIARITKKGRVLYQGAKDIDHRLC